MVAKIYQLIVSGILPKSLQESPLFEILSSRNPYEYENLCHFDRPRSAVIPWDDVRQKCVLKKGSFASSHMKIFFFASIPPKM